MTDDRSTRASLAAEYMLGLLTGQELRQARERLASDPDFTSEVARWRGRLAALHAESEPIEPPSHLWDKIEGRLPSRKASNNNHTALRRRIMVWKSIAAGMTAIAASLALLLLFEPRPTVGPVGRDSTQVAPPPMVAMLGNEGSMKVVASWNPGVHQLVLAVPGDMLTDPRHSNELWVIPSGGKPKSLGTMPASKQMHMQLANALASLLQKGATIAISVEPRGGSPTGAPTGPVTASGTLTPA